MRSAATPPASSAAVAPSAVAPSAARGGAQRPRLLSRSCVALAALGLVAVPVIPAASAAPVPAAQPDGTSVTLFNINDFHGRITSTAGPLACTLTEQRTALGQGGHSAFLSAGDNVGASEFASYLQDDNPTIDYLNALGLQASALGNHEFDHGADDLTGHIEKRADWTYLAANITTSSGERAAKPYTIVDADGVKVAVVGADTQETPQLTSPSGLAGLRFGDPVKAVNAVIRDDLVKKKEAGDIDVIVVEYHEGSSASATPPKPVEGGGTIFTRMVNETDGAADVIFTGHTHQTYSYLAPVPGQKSEERPIVQTGSYGANLGKVTLKVDAQGDWDAVPAETGLVATPKEVASDASCRQDPRFQKAESISADATEKGRIAAAKPVGSVAGDLTRAASASAGSYVDGTWQTEDGTVGKSSEDRGATSTLSNELADSMVWATQQKSYSGPKATIGVMNPGGVRADLYYKRAAGEDKDGIVSFGEANDVVPFVNNLSTVELTGEQFTQVLEQQWQRDQNGDTPSRAYLALGLSRNVQYTVDESAERDHHITSVTIDGKPLDPKAKYSVVAANFLTAGGDNFTALASGTKPVDTGLLDRDAWIDYLKAKPALKPDFSQRGVGAQIVPPAAKGGTAQLRVTRLESRSLGAPEIRTASVEVDGKQFSAPYAKDEKTGAYAAVIDLPACLPAGAHQLTISAEPDTGTAVRYPVTVTTDAKSLPAACDEAPTDPSTPPTDPSTPPTDPSTPPTDPSTEPTDPSTPPADPSTEPTDPGTEPTDDPTAGPSDDATDPGATDPGATDPGATDPGTTDPGASDPGTTGPGAGSSAPGEGSASESGESDSASAPGRLPRTGAEVAPYAIGAAALLVIGLGALAVRRRLRR